MEQSSYSVTWAFYANLKDEDIHNSDLLKFRDRDSLSAFRRPQPQRSLYYPVSTSVRSRYLHH